MKKLCMGIILPALLALMTSCGEDEGITLGSSRTVSLHKGEQAQIEATAPAPIAYGCMDEYHATVDNGGLITAGFVGNTQIRLKSGDDVKFVEVKVIPRVSILIEPSRDFGEKRALIKKLYGDPLKEEGNMLYYKALEGTASTHTLYLFDESDCLIASAVTVKAGNETQLQAFLSERYVLADAASGIYRNSLEDWTGAVLAKAIAGKDGGQVLVYGTKSGLAAMEEALKQL